MAARRLGVWLLAALGAVLTVFVIDSTGVVSDDTSVVIDNTAQLAAGATAASLCAWMSRRTTGPERRWRRLMAVGMGGWSVGQVLWSWYQVFSDTPLPSPSWADVGYLAMPLCAVPALMTLAIDAPRRAGSSFVPELTPGSLRTVVFVLDGMVVVGSLFVLTWSTALGAVVQAEAPTTLSFAVAIHYPVFDLVLVAIVGLLAMTGRVPSPLRLQLWLLGSGLVVLAVSDSIFAYLVTTGADEMPPIANGGYIAGPLLIGIAALATADHSVTLHATGASRVAERAHLLLPYVLVVLTGAVVAAQTAFGASIDRIEAITACGVVALVLVRQIITLLQNTALLERVSAAQEELAYRAQHDPLTGLANRALFGERLQGAMDGHRQHGEHFAVLLVDLDDFKAINDSMGHATGDRLLYAAGQRLRACVRSTDTVARLGGDEFAVVLAGPTEKPEIVGQRIIETLRRPFHIAGDTLSVGASVGVVEPDPDEIGLTPEVMLHRADGAMYVGKAQGKGMAVTYHPELLRQQTSRVGR